MADEVESAERVLFTERRLLAVGAAKIALAVVVALFMYLGGWRTTFASWEAGGLVIGEIVLGMACVVLALGKRGIGQHYEVVADIFRGEGFANTPRDDAPADRVRFMQSGFSVLTLGNFLLIGYLIVRTGGITASPFMPFAFTMVVLGLSMARARETRSWIFGLGVMYFAALLAADLFEWSDASVVDDARGIAVQVWGATSLNLLVAYAFSRKLSRFRRGIETEDSGGSPR